MKKLLSTLVLFCTVFGTIHAQTTMPQFEGGVQALSDYILDNINLPKQKATRKTHPIVKVKFLVKSTGDIDLVHIISEKQLYYDNEAIRLVKTMPKWIPAKRKGKNISLYRTVDVNFNLSLPLIKEISLMLVMQEASFPGGNEEIMKFLSRNLRYPIIAQENGIEGKVLVQFNVNKEGSISDVKVLRGIDPACDKEAVRVVKSMPKWIPAKQNGRTVSRSIIAPVIFKIQK